MQHDNHQHQKYTCPMHPEIIQDGPGNCPKCGMNLVPIKTNPDKSISHHQHSDPKPAADHAGHDPAETITADLNRGAQSFQKYTCPMHPQIVQDGPGKCPLCGMTWFHLQEVQTVQT